MKIRPYLEEDQTAVVKLWQECGLIVPWNNARQDIERKLTVNREWFLVGLENNHIMATAMAGYEGHRGWINYLAVHPAQRRKGYGRELMLILEELLENKGCPKISLQIRASNSDVISFYESLGYKDDNVISLGKRLIVDLESEPED